MSRIDRSTLDFDVPHLEGWTVRSVIGHTGWVFRFADLSLQADPSEPPTRSSVPEPPPGAEVVDWFNEGSAMIQHRLQSVDLDSMRPTWTGPQPAMWWLRRLSHEVSMHRWDAESAGAAPSPIDARQARDGIDEVLEIFVPKRMQFSSLAGTGETVHLHATDIDDGEWLLTYRPEQVEWKHSHVKAGTATRDKADTAVRSRADTAVRGRADTAARGTVSDLLLLLWGRIPPTRVEVFGEVSLLDRWQAAATF